jgi:hypothetical protein
MKGTEMGQILNHVTVVRDGWHNAFTDLIHWQGEYWVAYRRAQSHKAHTPGEIVIAHSADRVRWREAARLKVAGDDRDPTFAVAPDGRLAVLTPVILNTESPERIQQYIAFSSDGYTWTPLQPILEPQHHIFRCRKREGKYYGLDILRMPALRRLDLVVSDDLLRWQRVAGIGPDAMLLNESDIAFQPDGEAWVVARTLRKPDDSVFACARPPYTDWAVTDLKTMIHCPAILEYNGALYVAGRNFPAREGDTAWPFGRSLAVWRLMRGKVEAVLRIPAIGDCAYPGFIKDPDGRVCISYYSMHAYRMGVMQPFSTVAPGTEGRPGATIGHVSDIYFAELELP